MTRRIRRVTVLGGFLLAYGCSDGTPTTNDDGLVPVEAVTVELRLPFEAFATDFQRLDGFGSPAFLDRPAVAHEWGGEVEARALLRFSDLAKTISVRPPGSTTLVADSLFRPISARLTVFFDTLVVRGTPPFTIAAGMIEQPWHLTSVDWDLAVDTIAGVVPWGEPGAGPVSSLGETEWSPTGALPTEETFLNAVSFDLDSAEVATWAASPTEEPGFRISSLDPDSRLAIESAILNVTVRSGVNPDTVVVIPVPLSAMTFVATPGPTASPERFSIGGAPAVRAAFRMNLPATIEGSPEVCAVLSCPIELGSGQLVYAAIELYTVESDPLGLRPLNAIAIEVRPVLSPERLPRSPLGQPIACPTGQCSMTLPFSLVREDYFTIEVGTRIALPITRYVRDLLVPEGTSGSVIPTTLVLMNAVSGTANVEMRPLQYATFGAPGSDSAPTLRLILTTSEGVPVP